MTTCCDDLAYARTMKVLTDGNLGPAMKVKDPDEGWRFIPISHCPWCGEELRESHRPCPPVILHAWP